MRLLLQRFSDLQEKLRSVFFPDSFYLFKEKLNSGVHKAVAVIATRTKPVQDVLQHILNRLHEMGIKGLRQLTAHKVEIFIFRVKSIGFSATMDDYEKRKLGIFNQLNFLQAFTGLIVPLLTIFDNTALSGFDKMISFAPVCISILVLHLNYYRRYNAAMIVYFILYPFFTCLIYMSGMNLGLELYFILFGILSVFFIQDISNMLISIGLSMVSYFMLAVVLNTYQYHLETTNYFLYLFNQVLAILFIFYGLYLIKKENTGYQFKILAKNRKLHAVNLQIASQKEEIVEKAKQLELQTVQLTELNSLKNKLFSVIAHDLKTPIYALRNLFRNIQEHKLPAKEIKALIPDVVNDLNYTTGLMENLLQWAKSQMQADAVNRQAVDISAMVHDVSQLLRLQAEAKKIYIECKLSEPVYVYADRDMVHLVLRNLLSNAIKFTPEQGSISLGANEIDAFVEIFVQDTGTGMTVDALQKIKQNDYYTTKGTSNESGTGLGLMLCKEFLAKNGGQMHVESEPGKGSVFSFTLPKHEGESGVDSR